MIELKDTITETKKTKQHTSLVGLDYGMDITEDRIDELQDELMEFIQYEKQEIDGKKYKQSLRELWDNNKIPKFISLESQKENGKSCNKRVFKKKIMAENFSSLVGDIYKLNSLQR